MTANAAATALAEEFAPDLIEANHQAGDRVVMWDQSLTYLKPGITHHDGVTYVLVPSVVVEYVQKGRGKDAKLIDKPKMDWIVVTSEGRWFDYTEKNVTDQGFIYPDTGVQPDAKKHYWETRDAKAFIDGRAIPKEDLNPFDIFTQIRKVYERFVDFPGDHYYDMVSLYVLASYVYTVFPSTGYLHFNGTAQSGKSQNLAVLNAIGFNTTQTSSTTEATLFRKIEGSPGILCIDEAESFDTEKGQQIQLLLQGGYDIRGTAERMAQDVNDRWIVQNFTTYCPKVIASINALPDVLGTRTFVIPMEPSIRRIPEFDANLDEWARLRNQCYLFALYHMADIKALAEKWNAQDGELRATRAPKLINRQWQVAQQIVIMADYIAGERFAAYVIEQFDKYFAKQQANMDATQRYRVALRTLPRVMQQRPAAENNFYSLAEIKEILFEYLDIDTIQKFSTATVGKWLAQLGFNTKQAAKGGMRIQINEEDVREQFNIRRIEPLPEDVDWLAGKVNYQHTGFITDAVQSAPAPQIWAAYAEEADEAQGHTEASTSLLAEDPEPVP